MPARLTSGKEGYLDGQGDSMRRFIMEEKEAETAIVFRP